jgi:hypothetical protein
LAVLARRRYATEMHKRALFLFPAALGLTVAGLLASQLAAARVEADSQYTKAEVYSTALRYLRVDLGYKVLEKDPDAAYLLFEYVPVQDKKDAGKGSIQIVQTEDDVKIYVEIPKMPTYHEMVLRDGLLRKLHEEYGDPPPKAPPPKPAPARDAGSDGG